MSAFAVLKDAWQTRHTMGNANQSRELAAFLPAALEVQESPPNPLTQYFARGLIIFLIIACIWACVGSVNIVASAEGKIIPSSRVKKVQPLEKGVVRAVLVSEGSYVTQGQALVELDTTLTEADKKRLESDLHSISMRFYVNKELLRLLDTKDAASIVNTGDFRVPDIESIASSQEVSLYKSLLRQQWLQYQSQLQGLHSNLQRVKAEQNGTEEVISKLEQTLPIVQKRAATLKELHSKDYISENDYLLAEQERIQISQDLAAERQRVKQIQASEAEVRDQINLLQAQTRTTLLGELSDQQRQISALQEELIKARDMNAKRVLYSPVAGRVQELTVNTVGGVVTEAQQLMLIVPDEESLSVEVFLENIDIGFVNEGMPAEIKVHTFPFTKYGVIDAEVINVSEDAIVDEQRGLIFSMQLRMKSNFIQVEGKEVKLQPGMAVTAEVQTGQRKIIEFFLAPLLRMNTESLRER